MERETNRLENVLRKAEQLDLEGQIWMELTQKYESASHVTKEMVADLIEKLWVSDGQVTVELRYQDELEKLLRKSEKEKEVVA